METRNDITIKQIKKVLEELKDLGIECIGEILQIFTSRWDGLHVDCTPARNELEISHYYLYGDNSDESLLLLHGYKVEPMKSAIEIIKPFLILKEQEVRWFKEDVQPIDTPLNPNR